MIYLVLLSKVCEVLIGTEPNIPLIEEDITVPEECTTPIEEGMTVHEECTTPIEEGIAAKEECTMPQEADAASHEMAQLTSEPVQDCRVKQPKGWGYSRLS